MPFWGIGIKDCNCSISVLLINIKVKVLTKYSILCKLVDIVCGIVHACSVIIASGGYGYAYSVVKQSLGRNEIRDLLDYS